MRRLVDLAGAGALLLGASALGATSMTASGTDAPPPTSCSTAPEVSVRAHAAADAQAACVGAHRALAFLRGAGLEPPDKVDIDVVDALEGDLDGRAVGCYFPQRRRIQLLSWASFEATGQWLRTPVSLELYMAAASHETAHAVVACHAPTGRPPIAAHEYVAYVVLFATMDPALRTKVLARFPGTGFASTWQISDASHMADPLQFAADAWRHYIGRRSRAGWLRDVIAGGIIPEWPADGP